MSNALPGQADGQEQPPLALRLAHAMAEVRRAERRYVEGPERRATPPRPTASLPGTPRSTASLPALRIERVGRATVHPAQLAPLATSEAESRVRGVTRGKIVREGPPQTGSLSGEATSEEAFAEADDKNSALEMAFALTDAPGLLRRVATEGKAGQARSGPVPAAEEPLAAVSDTAAEAATVVDPQGHDAATLDVAAALAGLRAELAELREQARREQAHREQVRQANDEPAQGRRSSREAPSEVAVPGSGVPTAGSGSEVIVAIIPVIDDLERALAYLPAALRGDAWAEGVLMIGGRLRAALQQQGVVCEVPRGATFDPRRHEAVSRLETSDVPEDTITDVLLPGYSLNGRVLRPAQVQVAVRKEQ